MSKWTPIIKNKQNGYKEKGIKEVFKKEDGAIDLASIMVGVIVIGLIGGVIAATIFAVIPWTQDNTAKQQLDSIVQAENAYYGLSAASPSPLPAGTPANSFGKSADLANAKLLTTGTRYCVTTPSDGKSYTGYSQSSSGTIFTVTDKKTKPESLVVPAGTQVIDSLPTECQFITEGMATPTVTPTPTPPAPYVDPTPNKFILTYQCDTNVSLMAPIYNGTGNYTWTDGTTSTTTTTNANKNLIAGTKYTFIFEGTFTNLDSTYYTPQVAGAPCIRSVDHWGTATGTITAAKGFQGAVNLTSVPANIPTGITNMSNMFNGATSFNDPNVKNWDVSKVTNMSGMFNKAIKFNQDLSGWNTGLVTDMSLMFNGATAMNGALNDWNTSKVTNMSNMFFGTSFNQPLNNWDTANVTNMMQMFYSAPYTQDLTSWNMNKVNKMAFMMTDPDSRLIPRTTHPNMFRITYQCDTNVSLMTPIYNGTGNYSWNDGTTGTSLVNKALTAGTKYTFIFEGTFTNLDSTYYAPQVDGAPCIRSVDYWGTATGTITANKGFKGATNLTSVPASIPTAITNMSNMFNGATNFNDPNVKNWDVSKVTNMSNMFNQAIKFNQDLNGWNTGLVTDMSYMFSSASAMNGALNGWNTSKVTNMDHMFYGASSFNQPLNSWNTTNVTNMLLMFYGAPYAQDLTSWDMNKVNKMAFMLNDPDSKLLPRASHPNMFRLTYQCDMNASIMVPIYNGTGNYTWNDGTTGTSLVNKTATAGTKYTFIFEGTFTNLDSAYYAPQVAGAPCIRSVDYWGTATGTITANRGFKGASNLTSVPASIPTAITNMSNMFNGATNFNDPNVKNWDVSKVTNMSSMFAGATAFNQDLSGWNTAGVTNGTLFAPASFPDVYMPAKTSK